MFEASFEFGMRQFRRQGGDPNRIRGKVRVAGLPEGFHDDPVRPDIAVLECDGIDFQPPGNPLSCTVIRKAVGKIDYVGYLVTPHKVFQKSFPIVQAAPVGDRTAVVPVDPIAEAEIDPADERASAGKLCAKFAGER